MLFISGTCLNERSAYEKHRFDDPVCLGCGWPRIVAVLGSQNVIRALVTEIPSRSILRSTAARLSPGLIGVTYSSLTAALPCRTLASDLIERSILPDNGVAPIGDWPVRGHHALPLPVPDDVASGTAQRPRTSARRTLLRRRSNCVNYGAYAFLGPDDPGVFCSHRGHRPFQGRCG